MRASCILLAAFFTFGAFAQVEGIQELTDMGIPSSQISMESLLREMDYEQKNVPVQERAQREMNLLLEKIKAQVAISYQERIDEGADEAAAYEETKNQILVDVELAAPEMREELKRIALETLELVQSGAGLTNSFASSSILEDVIQKNLEERAHYMISSDTSNNAQGEAANLTYPSTSRAKDAERLTYNSTSEILQSLASNKDNTKWVSSASANHDLGTTFSTDSSFSVQLKFKFLGASVEGGPTISFSRKWGANAMIMSEGLENPVNPNGTFNVWKRDYNGNIEVKNGEKQRRFMAFSCQIWQQVDSSYKGEATVSAEAGLSAGIVSSSVSGSASVSLQSYKQTSGSLTSRRIYIPDSIGNRIVTVNTIKDLCQRQFINAPIRKNLTVRQSINIMMTNLIRNLAFSHPKSKCATDSQCYGWAKKNARTSYVKQYLYPRCVEEPREKYRYCEFKGLQNTQCAVYDSKGKMISPEVFGGYTKCDNGLTCKVVSPALYVIGTNWLARSALGKCLPVNAKSYRRPVIRY